MKESVVLNLSLAVFVMTLVFGCQVADQKVSNEELIGTTMAQWKASLLAKDLDKLMATYSENYVSTRGTGKDSIRERMARILERGFAESANVNIEGARTVIVGKRATFGPVELTSDRGTMYLEFILQKEKRKWLIIGSKRPENSMGVRFLNSA
jgi:biopolymer transport protein ExbB/TolQ